MFERAAFGVNGATTLLTGQRGRRREMVRAERPLGAAR
jgi:hypothetical protein